MVKVDRRFERGISTRERILDAAIDVIARGGASAATQRVVAEAAGVSLASVTYHFASAKELIVSAMRRAAGIAVTHLAAMDEEIISGRLSLEDATVQYIDAHRTGEFAAGIVALELSMAAVRDPDLRASDEDNIEALRANYAPLVSAPGHDEAAAAAFTGLLLLELGSTREPNSEETRRRVRALLDLFDLEAGVERERRRRAAAPDIRGS